jgi:two-component system OmpR family response regulator
MRPVLIVDDNCDATNSLALLLRLWGYDARIAYSATDALDVAPRLRPAVILLDIAMPEVDGYEVARELRQRNETRDAVIIAISGYGRDVDRQASLESGIDEHWLKPLEPQRLQEFLAKLPTSSRT